ncbi:uncharacterized protein [Anabrus simplex]|uniref:uncharacterized protein n=1 Tax=Anabrus simplex TaxID=316456 RepID=UPI0034DD3CD3
METWNVLNALSVLTVALLAALPTAESIHCYECNSKVSSDCKDLVKQFNESAHYVKCEVSPDGLQPFCRKRVFKVLSTEDERVVRTCSYHRHKNPCYSVDDDDHVEEVCQCDTDGCNSAPSRTLLPSLTLLGTLLLRLCFI